LQRSSNEALWSNYQCCGSGNARSITSILLHKITKDFAQTAHTMLPYWLTGKDCRDKVHFESPTVAPLHKNLLVNMRQEPAESYNNFVFSNNVFW
jgi:hypothetical protein